MSYKKFEKSDIFFNILKLKPRFEIKIENGKMEINSNKSPIEMNNMLVTPPQT